MSNPDAFIEHLDTDADGRAFAEPYLTPDGTTVIPVAKGSRPLGVYVIRDGQASWLPAVDGNRIATIGVITGLLSAVLGCLAILRRPPWPDLSGHGLPGRHR